MTRRLQLVTDEAAPIPTATEIADMDGDWRDPQTGQNLIVFLARFGSPLARRLLDEAADIAEARTTTPTRNSPRRA